jgi:transposase
MPTSQRPQDFLGCRGTRSHPDGGRHLAFRRCAVSPLSITRDERSELAFLEKILKEPGSSQSYLKRVQIIRYRDKGLSQEDTAAKVGISRGQVVHWERRFRMQRISGLKGRKIPGRRPWLDQHVKRAIVEVRRCDRTDGLGMANPSIRKVARVYGVSRGTVLRLWQRWDEREPLRIVYSLVRDAGSLRYELSTKLLKPFSGGPGKLYWRSGSVTMGLSQLRSALEVFFESDFTECRKLIEYLHIFDTATGPNLKTIILDWHKLINQRPKLVPEAVQRRINSQLPADARLNPELRLVSFVLPLKERPRRRPVKKSTKIRSLFQRAT